jgi:SnoaL-like domain
MPHIATDAPTSRARTIERFFEAVQAGDGDTLREVLTPNAITRWPQSGEQITGAMACINVYANYPGGPPKARIERIVGEGDVWVAEMISDYGTEQWSVISICEFEGPQIARMTDYFAPALPAPEWRRTLVDPLSD